jgi:hypothetical protein
MAPPLWPILMEIEVSFSGHDVLCLILMIHSDDSFRQYVVTFLTTTHEPNIFHHISAAPVTD